MFFYTPIRYAKEHSLSWVKLSSHQDTIFNNVNSNRSENIFNNNHQVFSRVSPVSLRHRRNTVFIFKAALKQAFIDGYLTTDLSAKIKGIPEQESRREYLTVEELNILVETPCEREVLKRAALFSALTGLRHCDIQKLRWKEISVNGDQAQLHFTQQKTKGVEYMPISQQALELCGETGEPEQFVFEDLPNPSWISRPLKQWVQAAGITKRITFHCLRHLILPFAL